MEKRFQAAVGGARAGRRGQQGGQGGEEPAPPRATHRRHAVVDYLFVCLRPKSQGKKTEDFFWQAGKHTGSARPPRGATGGREGW